MASPKKLNDGWFSFIGIKLTALMNIIFRNRHESGEERFGFETIYILSTAETMILWEENPIGITFYRKHFPSFAQISND